MRIIWTLIKIAIGLAVAIPVGLFVLAATAGVVGITVALAVLAAKLAFVALIGYGAYRFARLLFGKPKPVAPATPLLRDAPPRDPYYDAAMRELDSELGRH